MTFPIPRVSIIVPVCNVSKYLQGCLNSILDQRFQNWEAIIVCDGLKDDLKICEKYVRLDKRFRLIKNINQGLGGARNAALDRAQGEYILYVDGDDKIHPQLLEITLELMEKNNLDYVHFNFTKDFKNWPSLCSDKLKYKYSDNPLFLGVYKKSPYRITFNVWSALYRKSFVKNIRFIPNLVAEDIPYVYAVLSKRPKSILLAEKLYFYNQKNMLSLSHRSPELSVLRSYRKGLEQILAIYKSPDLRQELKFIKKDLIPILLKEQYKLCQKAPAAAQSKMWLYFSETLRYLKEEGMFGIRGHKITRYFAYRKLIKKGKK